MNTSHEAAFGRGIGGEPAPAARAGVEKEARTSLTCLAHTRYTVCQMGKPLSRCKNIVAMTMLWPCLPGMTHLTQ